MDIESRALTTCEIASDGSAVCLGLIDASGAERSLRLPVDQLGALAMTLPSLIEKALKLRYRDESLRYTYPLGSWALERASDAETFMMTLKTSDGFSVCFSMAGATGERLGRALAEPAPAAPAQAN
jgi:hypothetical protein